jgi:acetyltransferase-like isoleucine patch superfamily enzyme
MKRLLRRVLRCPELTPLGFYLRWRFVRHVLRINARCPWPVHWTSRVVCPERVKLGRGTTPGDMPGCYIQAINGIEIGDFCNFGPSVGLISANHDLMAPEDNSRHLPAPPIRLGERCWMGMGAIVLPGVELGPHTVVGAGTVVTKSFPEGWTVLAGNPARVVKRLARPSEAEARPGSLDGPAS